MTRRIGFAYNEKPNEEDEPPSEDRPPSTADLRAPVVAPEGNRGRRLHPPPHDRYAEWDEPATIDAVASALRRAGEVIRLEADAEFPLKLRDARPDIVFNIAEGLHGPNREAHVPAICEFLDVPYTGSDPLTLGLALDKRRAKEVFLARGIRTPAFAVIDGAPEAPPFPLPAIVKPLCEGSSKGIPAAAYCETAPAVRRRAREILEEYHQPALVEQFLPGREFTCAVLGNGPSARVLPPVEIRFDALPADVPPIYGYEAKWVWDTPEAPLAIFDCPARLDARLERALRQTALAAYRALGCRDWARIDLRLDAGGAPHVIEINPLPGILPDPRQNSCFPKAARAAGIDYDTLILTVLDSALRRYGMAS
ncbi:MAG TPA: hypothetical protein VF188_03105 [Longimicrobiales bacterium]